MLEKYKLGKLVNVTRGASLSGDYYAEEGELIRLTLGNFDYKSNVFKENTSKKDIFYIGEVDDSFVLEKGDIITPLTEQAIGLLGSTARIPESGKYIQSQDVGLVKCISDKIDDSFLYYLLATPMVKQQLSAGAQQTSIRHTSPDKIKDCSVYIPDVESQRKIGKLLETLDRKIALNRKINAELEQMAKELYDYWFVQFDFPNAEGKPYKSSGGKMVYNPQLKRDIPEGWSNEGLKDIANITMGQSPDGSTYNDVGNGVLFYQGSTDFGIRFPKVRQYTTAPTRYAKRGDILMSVRAPVGATNIANSDCCIGRGLCAMNSKIGSITYLYYVISAFESQFGHANSAGTTFGSITKDELRNLPVIRPKQSVINQFESTCQPIFDKQMEIGEENNRLTSLRDQLLPLLMNGQVKIMN